MFLELIHIFADNILPILLIAGVGFILRRRFLIESRTVSLLLFNALSPALMLSQMLRSTINGEEFVRLFAGTVLFQLLIASVAALAARLLHATPTERANLLIASFSLNAGNFGLSLISFAFPAEVLSRALVVLVANTSTNYTLGTFVATQGQQSLLKSLKSVLTTPAVWGLVTALIIRSFDLTLPLVVSRSIESLANAALPVMLILLGMELGQFGKFGQWRFISAGVIIRLLISPFLGLALAALLGINGPGLVAFIIQVSMPTAVITIIFTTQFGLERDLALNLIMLTTLLSPLTLSVLIYLLRGF